MMVVIGVLLALLERQQSGRGRVVNASMTDGATLLAGSMINGVKSGQKGPQKGAEIIDGTRPFYTTYRCADGNWMAVGAVEPKFFREVIRGLNLEGVVDPRDQMNPAKAAFIHKQFADKFLEKTRDEWERDFANIDACVSPVLELGELASHPHHQHCGTAFLSSNGNVEVGIVPRIEGVDHTPGSPSPARGADTKSVMSAYGISEQAQQAAIAAGIVRI